MPRPAIRSSVLVPARICDQSTRGMRRYSVEIRVSGSSGRCREGIGRFAHDRQRREHLVLLDADRAQLPERAAARPRDRARRAGRVGPLADRAAHAPVVELALGAHELDRAGDEPGLVAAEVDRSADVLDARTSSKGSWSASASRSSTCQLAFTLGMAGAARPTGSAPRRGGARRRGGMPDLHADGSILRARARARPPFASWSGAEAGAEPRPAPRWRPTAPSASRVDAAGACR